MRKLLGVALVTLLAACGDDGQTAATGTTRATTTTEATTTSTCPGFRFGSVHDSPRECLPAFLASIADQQGVALTDDARQQAEALCRRIDAAGVAEGTMTALADWETGAAPSPADDPGTFVAIAVGVYCPEHFEALRDS